MNTKKFLLALGLSFLAALAVLPGAAHSEMYVEGYMGGNFTPSAGMNVTTYSNTGTDYLSIPGQIDPAFHGGLKIGTWFVKEGFLGYDYPAWAKYFGFYTDFGCHRVDFRRQFISTPAVPGAGGGANMFFSEGFAATWAFMFACRYGFLPDAEVPFGRLQPYVAVGPAILFSSQNPKIKVNSPTMVVAPYSVHPGSDSSVDVALAVEAGLRWMALKNVSLEASFKYRYAKPNYSYEYRDGISPMTWGLSLNPTFHFLSFQVGAAYHF